MDLTQPIQWSEEFSIGIPLIDSQHRRLVEMSEGLRLAIVEGCPRSTLLKILKDLVGYCGDHFTCEEMLMQTVGYSKLSSHVPLHRQFTDQVLRWFEEFQAGNLEPQTVLQALVQWLVNHILREDTQITVYCASKGVKYTDFVDVADVIPKEDTGTRVPLELGMSALMLAQLALLCFVIGYRDHVAIVGPLVVAGSVALFALMLMFARSTLRAQTRSLQLASAKQFADNMLASEVAGRVAVMDLDDLDELLAHEQSPLFRVLGSIVEHLRLYIPHIPAAVLALVRGDEQPDDSEEEEEKDAGRRSPAERQQGHPIRKEVSLPQCEGSRDGTPSEDPMTVVDLTEERRSGSPCASAERCSVDPETVPRVSASVVPILGCPEGGYAFAVSRKGPSEDRQVEKGDRRLSRVSAVSGKPSSPSAGENRRSSVASTVTSGKPRPKPQKAGHTVKSLLEKWISRKNVSVLVAEIEGFSDLFLSLPDEQALALFGRYVTLIEGVCRSTKGMLNALQGDRLMLTWNAATGVGPHALQACKAALGIREGLKQPERQLGMLRVVVAVATGTATVGNLGSRTNLSFTVAGPVVSIAGALCSLNRFVQTQVLVCGNTWVDVRDHFVTKLVAQIDIMFPSGGGASDLPTFRRRALSLGCSLQHSGSVGDRASEFRRLFAAELKEAATHDEGEWMYVISGAPNPYAALNDAMLNLLFGNRAKGALALQAYVDEHPEDFLAKDLLEIHRHAEGAQHSSPFCWVFGWSHPARLATSPLEIMLCL
eukprot:RCo024196